MHEFTRRLASSAAAAGAPDGPRRPQRLRRPPPYIKSMESIMCEAPGTRQAAAHPAPPASSNAVAALTAMLPGVRIEARLSAIIGQNVIERTSQTIAALTDARRGIVETHRELSDVQHQIGLGGVAMGPLDKPESDVPRLPASGRVRIAA